MNTVKEDPADVVLKVYMQNEKGTLDKILDAFVKMKRYDILKAIDEPLSNLAQCFNKDDSGYHSNSNSEAKQEIISYTKDLLNDLPLALSKKFLHKEKDPNKPDKPSLRPSAKIEEKEFKSDSPILFLTFMEDGLPTAYNIKYSVDNWTDVPGITVITLNDRKDEVYQNPEKFIREYFEKVY